MKRKSIWLYILLIMILCLCILAIKLLKGFNHNNVSSKSAIDINFAKDDIDNGVRQEEILGNNNTSKSDEEIFELNELLNSKFFVLINKDNTLSEDYIPDDLVYSDIEFLYYIETRHLNEEVAYAARNMFEAAADDGIILLGASGFRSYETQENLFYTRASEQGIEAASQYTAPPGASEHQTGLALDILGNDYQTLDDNFDKSDSFRWLMDNCYKYGFILRYLAGKEDITGFNYEPWHFRYIGDNEIAEDIMSRNITLEEYIQEINQAINLVEE